MSRRVEALYEVLKQACKDQYGFAPERISENLQYLGTVGAEDQFSSTSGEPDSTAAHRFSDRVFGAEIHLTLNPAIATLFQRPEKNGEDWAKWRLAEYCKTDVQIQTERDAREANIQCTLKSPLWASVGPFVRSQYPTHESYVDGAIAGVGVYLLVERLAEKVDPELLALSEQIGAKDSEGISWYLQLAYQHEHELSLWEKVKAHPNIKAIDGLLDRLISGDREATDRVVELANEVCDLFREAEGDNDLIITLVERDRLTKMRTPAAEVLSPAP